MQNEKAQILELARKVNEVLAEAEASAAVKHGALLKVRAWVKQAAEINGEKI